MPKVDLSDSELLLLDGRVDGPVQTAVEAAKRRIAFRQKYGPDGGFLSSIVDEAVESGRLECCPTQMHSCIACAARSGYVEYKSGPKKGYPNFKNAALLSGYSLAYRFISVREHPVLGICSACFSKYVFQIREVLCGVEAEIPERLRTEGAPVYKRYDRKSCPCGWRGHEGEMRRSRTLFGDSTFPSGCPKCPLSFEPLGLNPFTTLDGFTVVETA